ncbi:hypothetical protein PGT21_004583 [Puccinia graminis f. sp. tritici]|uniref:RRM domain-containing protein n=2 Tax=Puccinia graminis f. sp. tritici TaxID=56615 RepID=H6QTX1_PUCGT|nr:uncharacterized protein PGTG_22242 [Puccinia graminis f. sp. tritici CRL 75-36-700-3]EHS64385.1 hypothetical protein PGTG_22242 [Puccinia graminis f. sp. tritici CRL 75-36-700-3]KAA1074414.1 hypothetical protein PGT21_004583 [Puccinia graminis f. sp. tritici]
MAISPTGERSQSPQDSTKQKTSPSSQSDHHHHHENNGRAEEQSKEGADRGTDDHPSRELEPEREGERERDREEPEKKNGENEGGEDKSSINEEHSNKSRSRREKDRVHRSTDRSRDRDRDSRRRHRDRSDRDHREHDKGERLERAEKTIDRSPGKDSDIRSHSSRPSHRRHRSRSHETAERSHTDRSRHRERDRRDRDRDRDRNRERGDRDLERDRERDKDREKDRARDRDPKRSHRSRDLDEDRDRHRKRPRSRSRERSKEPRPRDLDGRESERQRRFEEADGEDRRRRPDRRSPRYRPYEPTGSPPRRSSSPHLTEEEHEMRSVFVSQLSARVGDRELFQFFEQQAGKVRDARLITDRISRRSKGVGYVEFRELESVQKALALTGTKLLGLPVMVQYTEAEKNRQAMANTQPNVPPGFVATAPPPPVPRPYVAPKARGPGPNDPNSYARLYVGSLNFNLTDDDIRQVFQPFGDIEYVDLHRDQITGKSKGYAFVQFKNMHDAKNAMEKMNGFQLAGRALRVEIKAQPPAALLNATAPGVANPVIVTPSGGNFTAPAPSTFEERLEDPIGGNLNQISRVELMHKLARTEQPTNVPVTDMFRPNIPTATSRSVLLKNMFNPEEETEQGWDIELRDDVKGECEEKYGPVLAIAIEKESTAGDIYITFDSVPSAQKAITGLNNRWFGGRQITAAFISDALVAAHGGK